MPNARGPGLNQGQGNLDRVLALQADQTHLQGKRPQLVQPGRRSLLYQSYVGKADQIRVGFGRAHSRLRGQITQHHGLSAVHQHFQQAKARFNGLNTATFFVQRRQNGVGHRGLGRFDTVFKCTD